MTYFTILIIIFLHTIIESNINPIHAGITTHEYTNTPLPLSAPIVIAYREDGDGKGAVYDHYTVQQITNHPTQFSIPAELSAERFSTYINGQNYTLLYGEENDVGTLIPTTNTISYDGGLLIIPGRRNAHLPHPIRTKHEQHLIKEAYNRGQPIVAICAGSWQLWEYFGGTTIDVEGHEHLPMMSIEANGEITNNFQIHRISIENESLLAKAMQQYTGAISVNSIHKKAVNGNNVPDIFTVTARSIDSENEAEVNAIEAFETKHGAPMFGIQWHPEAYEHDSSQANILTYMAKTGDAYAAKRRMLNEFNNIILIKL